MRKLISLKKEAGSALTMFLVLFPLLVVLTGLVFDGGMMYLHYRRAALAATLGAHAASHAIDEDYFANTNRIILDHNRAMGFAREYANNNSWQPVHITNVTVRDRLVYVDATTTYNTTFMRLFGIPGVQMRVRGRAYPAYGIEDEWQ